MGFLTGKSKQTSESKNLAYPYLKDAYSGQVSAGTGATDMLSALLGIGGNTANSDAAFQRYKGAAGYQNVINAGTDAITGSNAARGLLRSGSTGKAYTQFAQDTAQQYYQQFLQNLLGLSGQGLQAGGLIGQAGQTSTQTSKSKPGLGKYLGAGLSLIPGGQVAGAALGGAG